MQDVAPKVAFGYRLNEVARKMVTEERFQFELQGFALQLLGTLFGAAAELFDLPVHAGDLGLLLGDLRLERVLGVKLRLVAHGSKRLLDLRLDRELDFPPGVVELAFLAKHV